MKIAFVTPLTWTILSEKIRCLLETEYPRIGAEYLLYSSFEEIPGLLNGRQEEFDSVVFSGQAAMAHADARLSRKTLWTALPKTGSSILCALLNASRVGWDITRLSFDSYSETLLRETYGELGYVASDMTFLAFSGVMTDSCYTEDALRFHRDNLGSGKANACLTGLQKVHQMLSAAKLPNIMVVPTRNVIREQLNFLQQFHHAKEESKGQISVMLVTINFPSDHSIMRESDDVFMMERTKIAQQIYRYAGQLQAAVLEASLRDYLLFSTRKIIETETRHYQNFDLLNRMERETLYRVSVGIGYGETVAGAKSGAVVAMLRAQKQECNSACVSTGDNSFLGPFYGAASPKELKEKEQIDGRLLKVADQTGVSVNTIYKLYRYQLESGGENFTSGELAKGLSISKRSMDRILQTLEEKGFAKVKGRRILSETGRPARVLAINFDDI